MDKININRLIYRIKHDYMNLNNAVIFVAFIIAANWIWGSLGVMQRNFNLQKELDDKKRQLILAQLDVDNAKLQQRYYQTNEYKELAVREKLGLVKAGESVLILPNNTQTVIDADKETAEKSLPEIPRDSNFTQWLNFLFGTNNKKASK